MKNYLKGLVVLCALMMIPLVGGNALAKKKKKGQFKANCGQDVTRLCKGVTKGGGRNRACLNKKKRKLSKKCRQYLASTAKKAGKKAGKKGKRGKRGTKASNVKTKKGIMRTAKKPFKGKQRRRKGAGNKMTRPTSKDSGAMTRPTAKPSSGAMTRPTAKPSSGAMTRVTGWKSCNQHHNLCKTYIPRSDRGAGAQLFYYTTCLQDIVGSGKASQVNSECQKHLKTKPYQGKRYNGGMKGGPLGTLTRPTTKPSSSSSSSTSKPSTSKPSTSKPSGSSSSGSSSSGNCSTSSTCYTTNSCCPDSSATGDRLKLLQNAKSIMDAHKKRETKNSCTDEKNLYYPRQCSGFVIDSYWDAGLMELAWMQHYDYNAAYDKNYAYCGSSGGKYVQQAASKSQRTAANKNNGSWRPNIRVVYMRDFYCNNVNSAGKLINSNPPFRTNTALKFDDSHCAHPWTQKISSSQVKPGDLWVSEVHVGIVYDAKRKILIHNGTSTGPTMDPWDKGHLSSTKTHKNIIFLRYHSWN